MHTEVFIKKGYAVFNLFSNGSKKALLVCIHMYMYIHIEKEKGRGSQAKSAKC